MRLLLIITALFIFIHVSAQENKVKIDSSYIRKYNDKFILKVGIKNAGESFGVRGNSVNYDLKPNTELKTKVWFNYRFIAFSLGFAPNYLGGNNDDDRKGKSELKSIGLNLIFPHWVQHFGYSKTKGYYISNTSDIIEDWDKYKGAYIQFPELLVENFSGYTAYKFNKNYSVKAVSDQTEHQIKSCGSLMAFLLYRYYSIDNKATITASNSTQKSQNFETTAQLGYFYTYVWHRNFYISAGAAAGLGFINSQLLTRTIEEEINSHNLDPLARLEAQCAMGYNSNRFFGGIQITGSIQKHPQGKSTASIEDNSLDLQVFLGYRFGMIKGINHLFDKYGL
ncbi:DUF4421 family protein [Saccharicrinis aurantiacus]|uniref:DUF4421 family protein n=1 Tax=Saccharicrinis aurantiacus TaxID=1849719 RepID=UPI000837BDD0|nr:DUF4421 family protein [Saccharicrinis aurantiacus]